MSQGLCRLGRAAQQARAKPCNLKGFLDAFKAIPTQLSADRLSADGSNATSLTHCEDFA
jgi:hypothetical protein